MIGCLESMQRNVDHHQKRVDLIEPLVWVIECNTGKGLEFWVSKMILEKIFCNKHLLLKCDDVNVVLSHVDLIDIDIIDHFWHLINRIKKAICYRLFGFKSPQIKTL